MKSNMNMMFGMCLVLLVFLVYVKKKMNNAQDYRTALLGLTPVVYRAPNPWNHPFWDNTYLFEFRYCYNSWRAYVKKQPSQLQDSCRDYLFNDDGVYYIYHSDSVHSLDKMMKIAQKWANAMQKAG